MKRKTNGGKAQPVGVLEHAWGEFCRAAELARKRPFGTRAVTKDAAENFGSWRRPRDLFDLGVAIDGIKAHAKIESALDVALFLDRVAIADLVGACSRGENEFDLGDRG